MESRVSRSRPWVAQSSGRDSELAATGHAHCAPSGRPERAPRLVSARRQTALALASTASRSPTEADVLPTPLTGAAPTGSDTSRNTQATPGDRESGPWPFGQWRLSARPTRHAPDSSLTPPEGLRHNARFGVGSAGSGSVLVRGQFSHSYTIRGQFQLQRPLLDLGPSENHC